MMGRIYGVKSCPDKLNYMESAPMQTGRSATSMSFDANLSGSFDSGEMSVHSGGTPARSVVGREEGLDALMEQYVHVTPDPRDMPEIMHEDNVRHAVQKAYSTGACGIESPTAMARLRTIWKTMIGTAVTSLP